MDMITLAMAKAYSDSKGGYAEPGKVLTFDGDTTGKHINNGGCVHISDEAIDVNAITKLVVSFGGIAYEGTDIESRYTDASEGIISVSAMFGENRLWVVDIAERDSAHYNMPKGVYVYCDPDGATMGIPTWVSLIELPETIHPIDPKFIPAVDSLTINGTDGKQYKLAVNNGAISVAEVV